MQNWRKFVFYHKKKVFFVFVFYAVLVYNRSITSIPQVSRMELTNVETTDKIMSKLGDILEIINLKCGKSSS